MLKPFQVKDLHRSELQQNSAEPTASLKRPSIDDGSDEYQTNIQSQPSHSRCRNGTVQLSSSDYDEIATTHPRARLTYVDDEDGEVITVGSSLELSQRLDEAINAPTRLNYIEQYTSTEDGPRPMHIFDIRRSNSVTEIWKKFEQRPQPPVLQRAEVDDGQRTEDPPSPTFEDGDALNPDLCTSASAQPSEPLLAAFEAELAKILDETSSSSNADHAQDGPQSSAEAQPRTNTDEPTTPGDAFAQAVHNLVNGAQLIRSGVRSRIPDLERQLRDVQRAVPEHVESTLQLALTTMESRVRNMTEAIHNTAPARVQRTNNLFWGECPVAATTVDGLRTMASEIGQMGQTLFTTFESELGYNTSRDQVQNHSGEAHGSSQLGGEATTDEPSADHPEYAPNTQQSHPNVPFEDEKESLDASRVGRGSSSQTRPHDGLDHADPPSQSQQSNMSQTPTSRQDGHAQQHPSLGAHHRPHMDIPPRIPAFPRPAPFYSPSYLPPPGPFHAPNPPPPPPPVPPFQTSPFHSSFWQPPQPAPSLWSRFPPHPPPPPHLRRAWQSGWPLGPKYNQDDSGVAAASTPGNSRNEPAVQTRSSTNKTLFIGNVGFRVTEKMIQGVFAAQGFLVDVHLPLDSETKEHAGFGYLHFASTYAAKAALEALQGTHIDGHSINLEFSDHSPIPNIQTPRDNEESTSQTHPDVRKASTDTRNSNPLSPRQLIDDSAEESTEQSSSKNTKSAASNASTNDQATNTYPRASALLDRDNEDVEFSTRYPSLIPEASSRGPRIPTTGRLPRLSPESEMNRFPPVSQLDAHMVANQRQDAESSSRPRVPNVPTGQGSRHPVNNLPPFDIPETHNRPHPHHGWRHLDTSDRRQSGRLLRRSNTMIPAHPASRLSGPFDPLAPAESNNSKGLVIGAYTVLDDRPRSVLEPKYSKFLRDMARTVMDHLDAIRTESRHLRAERMLVGIGSYLEGKGSLRNAWLQSSEPDRTALEDEGFEGQINQLQQTKQVVDDTEQASKVKATSKSLLPNQPERSKRSQNDRPCYKQQDSGSKPYRDRGTLSSQVSDAFSRAANVVRESLEVGGVVYFDATIASRGDLASNLKSDSEFSGSEGSGLSDDGKRASSKDYDAEKWSNPCNMLSYSTTDSSSINQELIRDKSIAMSEAMVRGLLRRYPRGKIFTFSEEGSISSDESTDGIFKDFFRRGNAASSGKTLGPTRKHKKTRQAMLRQDARALRQLAPAARSIIFMPLWDSHKNRWYSGCIAWTRTPYRIFTTDDELTFLFALGNSIMAEVHRLGAEYAEQAKTDLLSSLSHELRSPLHGIFGTAELLSDSSLSASQQAMVHTIESCSSTLLDTINHLLQYARINHLRQSTPVHSSEWDNPGPTERGASNSRDIDLRQTDASEYLTLTQLDTVLEEVVESVFAGYAFLQGPPSPLQKPDTPGGISSTDSRMINNSMGEFRIILDVRDAINWRFLLHPGRWRLILVDILGNALKFTNTGFVCVTLNATPITGTHGNPTESQITLIVSDTGMEIDEAYLENDLLEAFSPETALSSGTGLGLHVARHAILSLGGDIQVQSRKGSSTKVITKINLDHPPESATPGALDASSVTVKTRQLMRGRSIGILGLRDSEADKMLGLSLENLCRDWFNMEVCVADASQPLFCDYYIVTQENMDLTSITHRPGERFAAAVIVICSSPAKASAMYTSAELRGDLDVVEYISQPCGPRKMAKALKSCSSNQQRRHDLVDKKSETGPIPTVTELPVRPAVALIIGEEGKVVTNEEDAKSDNLSKVNVTEVPLSSSQKTPNSLAETCSSDQPDQGHKASKDSKGESKTGQVDNNLSEFSDSESVLIVDDNEINVRILEAYMEKLGYDYAVAQNGLEALEAFKANPGRFKIILMDISMPVMDGLDATKHIRNFEKESKREKAVTIVALTGLGQADIQSDAIGSGMNSFLMKPVSLKTLAPLIKAAGSNGS